MSISVKQIKIFGTMCSAWSLFGAYRGGKCYDYEYNEKILHCKENARARKPLLR